jgi:hypothetical protein
LVDGLGERKVRGQERRELQKALVRHSASAPSLSLLLSPANSWVICAFLSLCQPKR